MEESGRKKIENYMFENMRKLKDSISDNEDEEEDEQEEISAKTNAEDEMALNEAFSNAMDDFEKQW